MSTLASGEKFGKWTVIGNASPIPNGRSKGRQLYVQAYSVRCECGVEKAVSIRTLVLGKSSSCKSCSNKCQGYTVQENPRTYKSYTSMKDRCLRPSHIAYKNYGGRGIKICQRWLDSFLNFLADMGERPAGKTLDRYPNNDGNYEPGNCRWATAQEQRANQR